jgi:lysophospholipase L1-like esterase
MFGNYFLLGYPSVATNIIASPAVLAGLSVWSDVSDAATVTVNGASKSNSLLDKSGNARHFSQANANTFFWPDYIPNAQNGRAMLRFGGDGSKNLSTPSFFGTGHSEVTIFIVKKPNVAAPGVDVSHSSTGFYSSTNQNNWEMIEHRSDGVGGFMGNIGKGNGQCFVETFRYGGGIRTLGIDYRILDRAQTGTLGLGGGLFLGSLAPSGFSGRIDIGEVIVYNRALSDAELVQVNDYLQQKWNNAATENKIFNNSLFTFLGDSRTVGWGNNTGQAYSLNYPNRLMSLVGSGFYRNFGVAGDQVAQISARATSSVIPIYSPTKGKNIVVIWGGTNDLQNTSTSGADIAIAYGNVSQTLRNAGFKTIICTEIDRASSGLRSDYNTRKDALNAYHLANWTNYADRIVNFANQPLLTNPGAATNTTYFDPDFLHIRDAGYQLISNEIVIQVNSI